MRVSMTLFRYPYFEGPFDRSPLYMIRPRFLEEGHHFWKHPDSTFFFSFILSEKFFFWDMKNPTENPHRVLTI
jgi:hypothetical protein